MHCYPQDISDKTNLYTAIQTNAAYQGLKLPVKTTEDGKFVPDFTYPYMTEDIPYGLAVIRGIAEISGLETPNIDKVLTWCQEKMGKEYLMNSRQGCHLMQSASKMRIHHSGIHLVKALLCSELTFIENQIDWTPYWSLIVLVQF